MPTIDNRPVLPRPIRAARRVAVIAAVSLWLGACAPMEDWPPLTVAGTNPPAVEPASAPGPIALAPSITGPAAPFPAPVPVLPPPRPLPPPPVPAPAPTPVVAMPAPPPAPAPPAAAVEIPTFAPIACPPGAIAMWSTPDSAGAPVPICRRLSAPR